MPTYLVLIGLPGAGKGTQAKILTERLGLAHVSTGDLFRDHIQRGTDLGRRVEAILQSGALVPDDITIAMVRERLNQADCARGAVLDGYPRTPAQAGALDDIVHGLDGRINLVPFIQVPQEVLVERASGRRVCKAPTPHVYHLRYNPPRQAGVCDYDGAELYQRDDDREETVRRRIEEYLAKTAPLIEHYRRRGLLVEIDGRQPIPQVTDQLMAAVSAAVPS